LGAVPKVTCGRPSDWHHNQDGALEVPQVTIRTGFKDADGHEEKLTEYLCDYPGCPNAATRILGCLVELRAMAAVCDVHAAKQGR